MANIPLVYGGASFGAVKSLFARINTIPECQESVNAFSAHGYSEYDTSNLYGNGTSEEFFSQLDLKGGTIDTKIFPSFPGAHGPGKLGDAIRKSAKTLTPHKINILYLHAPDRSVPFEDTLREVNDLYNEGLFKEFGLSNYNSWEVAEIYWIAKSRGWVTPTVYQGRYNVLERVVELELIPCLCKYGIRFYAYSPLAGGLLTGRILSLEDLDNNTAGSRWDPNVSTFAAARFRQRYLPILPVFKELKETLERHNITLSQAALRWIQHHGVLRHDDRVIVGASTSRQLETNVKDSEGEPLPEDVVKLLDEAWERSKGKVEHYAS